MSDKWSDEELEAAIEAYIEMYSKDLGKIPFVKTAYYRDLSNRFGRTEKAFEYRMQNISHVFTIMNRPFLKGLVPAKNVGGDKMVEKLKRMIVAVESKIEADLLADEIENSVREPNVEYTKAPAGSSKPSARELMVLQRKRSQQVRKYVLRQAQGICENCSNPAPFITKKGQPFLEEHHVKPLEDEGSDTIENCIAVCPNCHKAFHYSQDAEILIDAIYIKVPRLKREN